VQVEDRYIREEELLRRTTEHVANGGRSRPSSLGWVSTTAKAEEEEATMFGNIEADCNAGTRSENRLGLRA